MILHEIYFDGLGGGASPGGPLADAIARDFGGMERWRSEFVATIGELHELAQSGSGIDLLKDFSEVAREELRAFTTP
jgi:superoxide dismutase